MVLTVYKEHWLILEPDKGLEYSINLFFIGGNHFVVYVVFVWRKKTCF